MTDADLQRLAATLLHFLWEGAAIALLAWALMTLVRSPRVRYAIGCVGLLAMAAVPFITFAKSTVPATPTAIVAPITALPQAVPTAGVVPIHIAVTSMPDVTLAERGSRAVAIAAPWIAAVWVAGVALVGVRHAIALVWIARLRRRAVEAVPAELRARLVRVARRMRITRPIDLLGTTTIDGPCVVGWLRPAILWPACAMSGFTPLQLDALLAHELAHIRRHDYLVNLLQAALETLGFYHPAVWWLSRRVRQEREHCCDDVAAEVIGDRVGYAEALAAFELLRHGPTFSLAAHGGSLMTRIRRLLVAPTPRRAPALGRLGTALLLGVVLLATVQLLHADPDAAAPAAQPSTLPTTAPSALITGDVLEIRIHDLAGPGTEMLKREAVTIGGKVSLPYLGQLSATGLTEREFEAAVRKAYRDAQILQDAKVTVAVVESPGRRIVAGDLLEIFVTDVATGVQKVDRKRVAANGEVRTHGLDALNVVGLTRDEVVSQINEAMERRGTRVANTTVSFVKGDELAAPVPMVGPNNPLVVPERIVMAGDLLRVTVMDSTLIRRVPQSGLVKVPFAGEVKVAGLTETQAETAVQEAARPKLDGAEALVSVIIIPPGDAQRQLLTETGRADAGDNASQRIAQMERTIEALQSKIREMEGAADPMRSPALHVDEAELAGREPFFARLLVERDNLAIDLARLQQVQGPNSPAIVKLKAQIKTIGEQIAAIATQLSRTPQRGSYFIGGAVPRSGAYELRENGITVPQAVIAAGGWPAGTVHITRRASEGEQEHTIDVHFDLAAGVSSDVTLQADDTLFVTNGPSTQPTDVAR